MERLYVVVWDPKGVDVEIIAEDEYIKEKQAGEHNECQVSTTMTYKRAEILGDRIYKKLNGIA